MHTSARTVLPLVVAGAALVMAGCAPEPSASDGADGTDGVGAGPSAVSCDKGSLPAKGRGKLTVGTDKPAYAPWFQDDDPANGKGFESAVAYAVAKSLGYGKDQVVWQTVPFNNSFSPGEKKFDFDINQVSVSAERKRAVDFSSGYYTVRQAVIALKSSPYAKAKDIAGLKKAKLGAQIGTTSLDTINDLIKPEQKPAVYQKNDYAKSALKNGQVDAIVVDLPTAFYITSSEVKDAAIVGQFPDVSGEAERFGLVLDKGSPLTSCVTEAVDGLRKDGTLAALEKRWLADAADAPVLK
ncbi:ABC transporter substrate-binding protein [Streptomyces sp. NPDC050560]|uniref:ABC transporter substrate-binding protein n=1 Tax=Streptomyces sp. NPDC050560 TaxID=3365630 RepID=UPI0037B38221